MPDAPRFNWPKLPERWRKNLGSWRPKFRKPDWSSWSRPQRIAAISAGSVLVVLLGGWIVLNFALASPSFGTPAVNWGLRTFGDKSASVATARLDRPFTTRFVIQTLDWPDRAEAESINITVDLLGWLPGRPWAKAIRIRNGDITLESKSANPSTFQPQDYVDRIDAENVVLHFVRRDKPKQVKIISASGSFSRGTVKAEAVSGRNHLTFDGLARQGGGFGGHVTAKGENLKDLAEIVGASAPDTPPFEVQGELATHMRTWSVSDITGRMGDSDISGLVKIDLRGKKPFLNVDLKSAELDFDDLGVVFGIPVGTGKGETTNAEQRANKAAFDRSARLIPDAMIDFARLKAVDADITFVAARVVDAPSGINAMNFKGELRDSVLDFERMQVKTGKGDLDAMVRIDARQDPASTTVSGTLENVPITRIINSPFIRGTLNGAFAINFTGSGFREAAGSATGEAGLWSRDSELAHIATEAAGLDLGEILLDLAREDDGKREYLKSTCLAANLAFANGKVQFAPAVLDNKDSLILITGGADLRTEALDLKVFAAPKDVSIGKLRGDITVTGTLRHPDLHAPGSGPILQVGFAAILSSIAGPLAALPFIETGGGPDANCGQLLTDARTAGRELDPTLKKRVPG